MWGRFNSADIFCNWEVVKRGKHSDGDVVGVSVVLIASEGGTTGSFCPESGFDPRCPDRNSDSL